MTEGGFSIPAAIQAKDREAESTRPFTAPPRLKQTISPGLAIGHAAVEASSCITSINIHGVRIGLLRKDRPEVEPEVEIIGANEELGLCGAPYFPRATEPLRSKSGKGRVVTDPFKQMAICAALGTVPSFIAGITLPTIKVAAGALPLAA